MSRNCAVPNGALFSGTDTGGSPACTLFWDPTLAIKGPYFIKSWVPICTLGGFGNSGIEIVVFNWNTGQD